MFFVLKKIPDDRKKPRFQRQKQRQKGVLEAVSKSMLFCLLLLKKAKRVPIGLLQFQHDHYKSKKIPPADPKDPPFDHNDFEGGARAEKKQFFSQNCPKSA